MLEEYIVAWVKPEFSRKRVARAGQCLIDNGPEGNYTFEELVQHWDDVEESLQILSNWRSSHSYPLNTFQASLRAKLNKLGLRATVAQRLKRIPSILAKLRLNPQMSLARMQDIGGLRAVVENLSDVYKLREAYLQSRFDHELVTAKDYIQEPKSSGYRGIHLIYRYKNRKGQGPNYEGLQVELQIRNRLQHCWATAVETAGVFLNQALKSSQGSERWLEFFSYASSAFAILEKTPVFEGHRMLSKQEIFRNVFELERELAVVNRLEVYKAAVDVERPRVGAHYFLMRLDASARKVKIQGYSRADFAQASNDYLEAEKEAKSSGEIQVVLVVGQSIDSLKKAYPNYFLDTANFVRHIKKVQVLYKALVVSSLAAGLPKPINALLQLNPDEE
jgi:hypothetical protein